MNYVLEAVNITKKFPGVLANDEVNINVKNGEVLGLIGENGAGKSTILKVLNGIYPSGTYTGKLLMEGKEIQPKNSRDAINLGIGYVPQEISVLRNFSVAENIFMSDLRLENIKGTESNERINKANTRKTPFVDFKSMYVATKNLLKDNFIDLDPRADVRKLSIGQQQMLMIARALSTNPKVLILDEPTSSLSSSDVFKLFKVVRMLKEKGTGIIFVTHKLAEIIELTDRVTILRDGKNISTFDREKYDTNQIITDMIGREITSLYPERSNSIGSKVLEVKGLTVEHPYIEDRNLVDDISFNVHEGEVLGLSGLVGAGRTEVCMAIYGVLPLKSGKIFIDGEEIIINNTEAAVKNKIGLVSEDRKKYGLNFKWDIKNNITISNLKALSKGLFVPNKSIVDRAKVFFDKYRIKAPSIDTKVSTLSGGNQQKVVLARSMNGEPRVVILDEPTKGIDVGSKNEIYQQINDLTDQGAAIIMVSSELPELMAMSDRFVVMAEGRVVGELSKDEATEDKIMKMAVTTYKPLEGTKGGNINDADSEKA